MTMGIDGAPHACAGRLHLLQAGLLLERMDSKQSHFNIENVQLVAVGQNVLSTSGFVGPGEGTYNNNFAIKLAGRFRTVTGTRHGLFATRTYISGFVV